MDKNSITGVILIVLIVVGYNALFPPVVEVESEGKENTTVIVEEKILSIRCAHKVNNITILTNELHMSHQLPYQHNTSIHMV